MTRSSKLSRLVSVVCTTLLLVLTGISQTPSSKEAPTGFDNQTNGMVPQSVHHEDGATFFSEVDTNASGLGPLFNGTSCNGCHSGPVMGGGSNTLELRAGHLDSKGNFANPTVSINGGSDTISGRSLINTFAICPQAQETVSSTETIRAPRISVNTLGDGFVEAIPDSTLLRIAQRQRWTTGGQIHGQPIQVDVLEAPGVKRVGRFGWKDQQASLLSFAADAYLNEQGITSHLLKADVTSVCDNVADPEDNTKDSRGFFDIEHFARFIRATKAPPRDPVIASQPDAIKGAVLFERIGCSQCHVSSITTAPPGTKINGNTFTIPEALGNKIIHPYSDFLLHNVGTGDGIVQNGGQSSANKVRTPPLWGLRKRTQLMHDGGSLSYRDAVLRHSGEASRVLFSFRRLSSTEQSQLLKFLASL